MTPIWRLAGRQGTNADQDQSANTRAAQTDRDGTGCRAGLAGRDVEADMRDGRGGHLREDPPHLRDVADEAVAVRPLRQSRRRAGSATAGPARIAGIVARSEGSRASARASSHASTPRGGRRFQSARPTPSIVTLRRTALSVPLFTAVARRGSVRLMRAPSACLRRGRAGPAGPHPRAAGPAHRPPLPWCRGGRGATGRPSAASRRSTVAGMAPTGLARPVLPAPGTPERTVTRQRVSCRVMHRPPDASRGGGSHRAGPRGARLLPHGPG